MKTVADLQNLIVATILRQTRPFTQGEIVKQVRTKLRNSPLSNTRELVPRLCARTIMHLELANYVRGAGEKGRYQLTVSFAAPNRMWVPA